MNDPAPMHWTGYLRSDGRKGVRNLVLVIYTVECAQHVAHAAGRPAGAEAAHVRLGERNRAQGDQHHPAQEQQVTSRQSHDGTLRGRIRQHEGLMSYSLLPSRAAVKPPAG